MRVRAEAPSAVRSKPERKVPGRYMFVSTELPPYLSVISIVSPFKLTSAVYSIMLRVEKEHLFA